MRKLWIGILITVGLVLGGCSFVEEANNTVSYVNEATSYLNEVNDFVNEVPAIASEAVNDPQTLTELESKLIDMKNEIQSFSEVQAPEITADLHQQILDYSQQAEEGIDLYLTHIEEGKFDPSILEDAELFQTLEEITTIVDEIKQLGL
ncbi:DUF6376 family protein [Niallia sp. XMNu-256]|uniref:DUF6376 family protein n=1 Tax=Niallia sp. XMNu-256 TaxID=3082444 RepID=UPI0030D3D135